MKTATAPITEADADELLALPRRNAHRIIGMLQDCLDPAHGMNPARYGSKTYPALDARDRAQEIALAAGFIADTAPLGPRGGTRYVIQERALPGYRAGLAVIVERYGWLGGSFSLDHPALLAALSATPSLIEIAPERVWGRSTERLIDELAEFVEQLSTLAA